MTFEISDTDRKGLMTRLLNGKLPDEHGRFGPFGGRYAPETLVPALERLEAGVNKYLGDAEFQSELGRELETWVGRPTPLTHARGLSERWGADVYLKREDMAHTGAHKINNALGQALLAKKIGAETRHRRDRRRAARRRLGAACARSACRAPCTWVRRCRTPGAECRSHDSARRQSRRRRIRRPDAARGHRRSVPALGRRSRGQLLPARFGGRPAPVSVPRARTADRDRARGEKADGRAGRRPAGCRDCLRRRRLERDRPVSSVSRRREGCS